MPLKEILDTNLFDFEKAATGAGWLQSLKEDNMITHVAADGSSRRIPKPETIECVQPAPLSPPSSHRLGLTPLASPPLHRYGITSFVYRERRPFHPERLWELMSKPFAVIQTSFDAEEDESDEEEDSDEGSDADDDDDEPEMTVAETLAEEKAALDLPARAKYKREHPVWKTLLRSKGRSRCPLLCDISAPLLTVQHTCCFSTPRRLLLAGDPQRRLRRVEPGRRESPSCSTCASLLAR